MPRSRLPHLIREKTRHGKFVWYFRVGKTKRIRLKAEYGTPEFADEYRAALDGAVPQGKSRALVGSLQWLYERYRETSAWTSLSAATRRQRENIFSGVMATGGANKYTDVTRKTIMDGRERRGTTPSQARNFLDAMRGLFRWALAAEHVTEDPTAGVLNPPRPSGDGFPAWTEEDVSRYEARWPVGTKERVWLDLLLYTGLRRGDAVRLGRQHVRNGVAFLKTEKSRFTVEVTLPVLPALAATLKVGPTADLAFICGDNGKPLTKESFGNVFREACRAAGVNKSAHGVRKIGATRAAENGATVAELEAIFGWTGGAMASLYTRKADRARLARGAMSKMAKAVDSEVSFDDGTEKKTHSS